VLRKKIEENDVMKEPNKAPEPTPMSVTPAIGVAHL
jgi:hypothetical protein